MNEIFMRFLSMITIYKVLKTEILFLYLTAVSFKNHVMP